MTEPLWAKCGKCGHAYAPLALPIELGEMGRILKKAKCPKCGAGAKELLVAKQSRGRLKEPAR